MYITVLNEPFARYQILMNYLERKIINSNERKLKWIKSSKIDSDEVLNFRNFSD